MGQHPQPRLHRGIRGRSFTRWLPRKPVPRDQNRFAVFFGFLFMECDFSSGRGRGACGEQSASARWPSQAVRTASTSSAVATPSRRFSTARWVNAATRRQASCCGSPATSVASHSAEKKGAKATVSSRDRGTAVPLGSASNVPPT